MVEPAAHGGSVPDGVTVEPLEDPPCWEVPEPRAGGPPAGAVPEVQVVEPAAHGGSVPGRVTFEPLEDPPCWELPEPRAGGPPAGGVPWMQVVEPAAHPGSEPGGVTAEPLASLGKAPPDLCMGDGATRLP